MKAFAIFQSIGSISIHFVWKIFNKSKTSTTESILKAEELKILNAKLTIRRKNISIKDLFLN